ncbi:hypothetical protein NPIL_359251 [Nephila pilipes]|uniref:Uncharacterized protein n=1 Tax=Nephila pilipes TaxID=299642 RepID=A0A8X6U760_NEPPI|nr:hypothetical protein NPIL_359251 [Nephila pilipes]
MVSPTNFKRTSQNTLTAEDDSSLPAEDDSSLPDLQNLCIEASNNYVSTKLPPRIMSFIPTEFSTVAIKYGLANEEIAWKQHERKHPVTVLTCGLCRG